MVNCANCSKTINKESGVYCSNKCQADQRYESYIFKWKNGVKNGSRGLNTKNLSGHLVRYIFSKYDNKCFQCGWCEVNIYSNKLTLEIDHIDGNSENNSEYNLVLLCPNCHSLTSTYKNLNKGSGRAWRREKYGTI